MVLLLETMEKLAKPLKFFRGFKAEESALRRPKQDAYVRELAGKRFVDVTKKAEAVAFKAHGRLASVRKRKKSSIAAESFLN